MMREALPAVQSHRDVHVAVQPPGIAAGDDPGGEASLEKRPPGEPGSGQHPHGGCARPPPASLAPAGTREAAAGNRTKGGKTRERASRRGDEVDRDRRRGPEDAGSRHREEPDAD